MKIQLVTQMWPSEENPDLGSFLVPIVRELETLGHEVEVSSISRRGGGPVKYGRLVAAARRDARRLRPDVVFAHFLFPAGVAGAVAAKAAGAPLVVMAHGQDVANLEQMPWTRRPTRAVLSRASGLIVNSTWLGEQLEASLPGFAGSAEVIDCGIDLETFAPRDAHAARTAIGWDGEGPSLLCVGSLIERKNVIRLADAVGELGSGRLAFVGDGPLRGALEGRERVRVVGRVPHAQVPEWIGACDVLCQPSLREPFGQALLEAMSMERTVLGTRVGGPPEFVTEAAGVLVDPTGGRSLVDGLRRAIEMPAPNPAAREAAASHSVDAQAARMADLLRRAAAGAT